MQDVLEIAFFVAKLLIWSNAVQNYQMFHFNILSIESLHCLNLKLLSIS